MFVHSSEINKHIQKLKERRIRIIILRKALELLLRVTSHMKKKEKYVYLIIYQNQRKCIAS
jgi:hypothetical protein